MRSVPAVFLLVVGSLLASPRALAEARATVTVNGITHTLSQPGFAFYQVDFFGRTLAPGEGADFSLDYTITVEDDGLTVPLDPQFRGCAPLHEVLCTPNYTGFELAQVQLLTFYSDPRQTPPFISRSSSNPLVSLSTPSDSFADSLMQSGTISGHVQNTGSSSYSVGLGSYVALSVLAAPIPEPASAAQLLAGLALVGGLAIRRRRGFAVRQGQAGPASR